MDSYKPLQHQIAGHFTYGDKNISCILESQDSERVFKLIKAPPKGHEEMTFYRTFVKQQNKRKQSKVKSSLTDSGFNSEGPARERSSYGSLEHSLLSHVALPEEQLEEFQNFTSDFYGITSINGHDYIELENLYSKFKNPCLADIKMGRYNFDPLASEEKRERRIAKFPARLELGYAFSGIKTHKVQLKKDFGRSLTVDSIGEAFEKFLPQTVDDRKVIIHKFLPKLERLKRWFEVQKSMKFYCSSLFMIYCRDELEVDVRMIDFAHVFYEPGETDENYLLGLNCLIRDFKKSIDL